MKPPKFEEDYPDRALDCEFEMEPYFESIVKYAVANGWDELEAVSKLTLHRKLGSKQNDMVAATIYKLRPQRLN